MPSALELAVIANEIYDQNVTSIGPWNRVDIVGNDSFGFYAGVYLKNNSSDMVVAFRGTDDTGDVIEDFGIFLGQHPSQAIQASSRLRSWINQLGSNRRIFLTGHSLGGGLAVLMSCAYNLPAITFNAPGMARASVSVWMSTIPGASTVAAGVAALSSKPDLINIRAYFDVVSIGTGPQIGNTHNISLACPAPSLSVSEIVLSYLPGYSMVRSVITAGNFVMCQHSMDNVVAAMSRNGLYTQEIDFSRF